jgi:hypothetical protein
MNKAIIVFISFLLLFLFLGCAQKQNGQTKVEEKPTVEEKSSQIESQKTEEKTNCATGNVLQRDECFFSLAKNNSNPDLCKNIYSIDKIDECYLYFAEKKGTDFCLKVTDFEKKDNCLLESGIKEKSKEICEKIGNLEKKKECLKQAYSVCALIDDIERQNLCFALERNNYSECKSTLCLYNYAKNKSNEKACLEIESPKDRFSCLAVVKKEQEYCENLEYQSERDFCFKNYSIERKDDQVCEKITNETIYSKDCYSFFALYYNKTYFCEKISKQADKYECLILYASKNANTTACEKIDETINRGICYIKAASENRMPSLCNDLPTISSRQSCYSQTILNNPDGPLIFDCPNIKEKLWEEKCYFQAAIKTKTKEYCNYIKTQDEKEKCLDTFLNLE